MNNLILTKKASHFLANTKDEIISQILTDYCNKIKENIQLIVKENHKDLLKIDPNDPKYDRLFLDENRIENIANSALRVAKYEFESMKILEKYTAPSGIEISKIQVPLGVVGMIYESRPNVTVDAIILCLKSKNCCVLKGSHEAQYSNEIFVKLAHDVLLSHNFLQEVIYLMPPDRNSGLELIKAREYVDVCIPRGSQNLIDFVRKNALIPIIETGAGVVNIYIDKFADSNKASEIIFNAKTRRTSVCNALDCMIIHEHLLPKIYEILSKTLDKNVMILADQLSYDELKKYAQNFSLNQLKFASDGDFSREFLSLCMAVKTVKTIDEAIDHITQNSSKHSDGIISENANSIEKFTKNVDSAAIFVNTSTAFSDGEEFGMICEIGISTQKLHTRGPFSLNALTSYKWIISSDGKVR